MRVIWKVVHVVVQITNWILKAFQEFRVRVVDGPAGIGAPKLGKANDIIVKGAWNASE